MRDIFKLKNIKEIVACAIALGGEYPKLVREYMKTPELFDLNLYKQLLLADAHDDFDCFCRYLEWEAKPHRQFYLTRQKYLHTVAENLQKMENDEFELTKIALIQRSGKTELVVARFLAWISGRNPNAQSLVCTGSANLADGLFRKIKTIVHTEFREAYLDVFPEMTVSQISNQKRSIWLNRESEYGNISIVSIDQNFEGICEVNDGYLIMDDIVSKEIANNNNLLAKQYEVDVQGNLMGRFVSGKVILCGTPQHPEDAQERFYKDQTEAGWRGKKISIPIFNDKGESNYEIEIATQYYNTIKYKKKFTTKDEIIKKKVAEKNPVTLAAWNTHRMMLPMTSQGLVLPELNYWVSLPEKFEWEFTTVDTRTKGSDAFVATNMGVLNDYGYVKNIFYDNGSMVRMIDRLVDWVIENEIKSVDFESNAAGSLYHQNFCDEIKKRGYLCKTTSHFQSKNKHDRIMASVETISQKFLFNANGNKQYKQALEQVKTYTSDGKAMHDDVIDCLAFCAEKLVKKRPNEYIIMKRFF